MLERIKRGSERIKRMLEPRLTSWKQADWFPEILDCLMVPKRCRSIPPWTSARWAWTSSKDHQAAAAGRLPAAGESHKTEKVNEVIEFVRRSGGIEYAQEVMYRYRQEAFDLLEQAPDTPARQALRDLLVYVTERKK